MVNNNKIEKHIIKWIPLILVEIYLVTSLVLYQFGPIHYHTENVVLFWCLILVYHAAFIVGYCVAIKKNHTQNNHIFGTKERTLNSHIITVFLVLCLIAAVINYRNIVKTASYIPFDFFQDLYKGLTSPAEQYYSKFTNTTFNGNNIVTLVFAILSFANIALVPVIVFMWERINIFQKIFGIMISFYTLSAYISIGTNKGIFDMLFLYAGSLFIEVMTNYKKRGLDTLWIRKAILIITIVLLVFSLFYFTYAVRDRTGNNMSGLESKGNIQMSMIEKDKPNDFFESMVLSVTGYVTQGYYGMSISVGEPFTSTYGIGYSKFLLTNVNNYFHHDFLKRTYQHKISEKWDESEQWHSFYSYWANDISFYGVIILMFMVGFSLAIFWKYAIMQNIIAKCILLLYIVMFMYMPANNQLFNVLETFCGFWEMLLIWAVYYLKKIRMDINSKESLKGA